MTTTQFQEHITTPSGLVALLIALTGVSFAVFLPGVSVVLMVLLLLVNLWLLYLVYRLVVAVEELAYQS
ncbi:hypothetical protein EA473_01130 [Natrarchaeobius chitinivorans]|uniref:Uncharacterized protein n=1 Tax=Natrarchaeobius chitinivorans TaxID=1679083 RepID=A0A3N6MST9_NATCH|nr:hypothetical protein EA473_01130 [Natrarchaeobius chitinivorans]